MEYSEKIETLAGRLVTLTHQKTVTPADDAVGTDGKPWTYDDEQYDTFRLLYADICSNENLDEEESTALWERACATM